MPPPIWLVAVIFLVGAIWGFFIKTLLVRHTRYGGTIHITQVEEKTLYSLELEDYPESISLKKEIMFKVDTSDESLKRE